jgi:hypothetical protein
MLMIIERRKGRETEAEEEMRHTGADGLVVARKTRNGVGAKGFSY